MQQLMCSIFFVSLFPMDPLKIFDKISNSPDNANSDSLVNKDNTQEVKDAKEFDMTSGTTQCYKQVG